MTDREPESNNGDVANGSLSSEDRDSFIKRFEDLNKDFSDMEGRASHLLDRWLHRLAGPRLDGMLRDKTECVSRLMSMDAGLRAAAVYLTINHWKMMHEFAAEFEGMVVADPDVEVRETAAIALGSCYAETKNPRIGHLLAGISLSASAADSLRIAAFTALLRVHGLSDYKGNSRLTAHRLADIDWEFVAKFNHAPGESGTP